MKDDFRTYLDVLTLLVPVFSAAACITLTGFSRRDCLTPEEKTLKTAVILYMLTVALAWGTAFCYFFLPEVFVFLNIPCLAGFVMAPVFFYRIVRFLTAEQGQAERFPPAHYLLPALIAAVLFVWSLFVPFDVQEAIVRSRSLSFAGEYAAYARLFTSKPLMRMLFLTFYYTLSGILLVRCCRRTNGADSRVRKPVRRVLFLVGILLVSVFSSMAALFVPRDRVFDSAWTPVAALCVAGQHVALAYHIIRRKYLLHTAVHRVKKENVKRTVTTDGSGNGRRTFTGQLTRERLEGWFRDEKPFLNVNFKISDVVEAMDVNRTVVSSFINREYGMNFNRFVNRWRLAEIDRLAELSGNGTKYASKLFAHAGFSEPQQYYRAVAAEHKATTKTAKKSNAKKKKLTKRKHAAKPGKDTKTKP
jgi:AraC-like DNA-binding protein